MNPGKMTQEQVEELEAFLIQEGHPAIAVEGEDGRLRLAEEQRALLENVAVTPEVARLFLMHALMVSSADIPAMQLFQELVGLADALKPKPSLEEVLMNSHWVLANKDNPPSDKLRPALLLFREAYWQQKREKIPQEQVDELEAFLIQKGHPVITQAGGSQRLPADQLALLQSAVVSPEVARLFLEHAQIAASDDIPAMQIFQELVGLADALIPRRSVEKVLINSHWILANKDNPPSDNLKQAINGFRTAYWEQWKAVQQGIADLYERRVRYKKAHDEFMYRYKDDGAEDDGERENAVGNEVQNVTKNKLTGEVLKDKHGKTLKQFEKTWVPENFEEEESISAILKKAEEELQAAQKKLDGMNREIETLKARAAQLNQPASLKEEIEAHRAKVKKEKDDERDKVIRETKKTQEESVEVRVSRRVDEVMGTIDKPKIPIPEDVSSDKTKKEKWFKAKKTEFTKQFMKEEEGAAKQKKEYSDAPFEKMNRKERDAWRDRIKKEIEMALHAKTSRKAYGATRVTQDDGYVIRLSQLDDAKREVKKAKQNMLLASLQVEDKQFRETVAATAKKIRDLREQQTAPTKAEELRIEEATLRKAIVEQLDAKATARKAILENISSAQLLFSQWESCRDMLTFLREMKPIPSHDVRQVEDALQEMHKLLAPILQKLHKDLTEKTRDWNFRTSGKYEKTMQELADCQRLLRQFQPELFATRSTALMLVSPTILRMRRVSARDAEEWRKKLDVVKALLSGTSRGKLEKALDELFPLAMGMLEQKFQGLKHHEFMRSYLMHDHAGILVALKEERKKLEAALEGEHDTAGLPKSERLRDQLASMAGEIRRMEKDRQWLLQSVADDLTGLIEGVNRFIQLTGNEITNLNGKTVKAFFFAKGLNKDQVRAQRIVEQIQSYLNPVMSELAVLLPLPETKGITQTRGETTDNKLDLPDGLLERLNQAAKDCGFEGIQQFHEEITRIHVAVSGQDPSTHMFMFDQARLKREGASSDLLKVINKLSDNVSKELSAIALTAPATHADPFHASMLKSLGFDERIAISEKTGKNIDDLMFADHTNGVDNGLPFLYTRQRRYLFLEEEGRIVAVTHDQLKKWGLSNKKIEAIKKNLNDGREEKNKPLTLGKTPVKSWLHFFTEFPHKRAAADDASESSAVLRPNYRQTGLNCLFASFRNALTPKSYTRLERALRRHDGSDLTETSWMAYLERQTRDALNLVRNEGALFGADVPYTSQELKDKIRELNANTTRVAKNPYYASQLQRIVDWMEAPRVKKTVLTAADFETYRGRIANGAEADDFKQYVRDHQEAFTQARLNPQIIALAKMKAHHEPCLQAVLDLPRPAGTSMLVLGNTDRMQELGHWTTRTWENGQCYKHDSLANIKETVTLSEDFTAVSEALIFNAPNNPTTREPTDPLQTYYDMHEKERRVWNIIALSTGIAFNPAEFRGRLGDPTALRITQATLTQALQMFKAARPDNATLQAVTTTQINADGDGGYAIDTAASTVNHEQLRTLEQRLDQTCNNVISNLPIPPYCVLVARDDENDQWIVHGMSGPQRWDEFWDEVVGTQQGVVPANRFDQLELMTFPGQRQHLTLEPAQYYDIEYYDEALFLEFAKRHEIAAAAAQLSDHDEPQSAAVAMMHLVSDPTTVTTDGDSQVLTKRALDQFRLADYGESLAVFSPDVRKMLVMHIQPEELTEFLNQAFNDADAANKGELFTQEVVGVHDKGITAGCLIHFPSPYVPRYGAVKASEDDGSLHVVLSEDGTSLPLSIYREESGLNQVTIIRPPKSKTVAEWKPIVKKHNDQWSAGNVESEWEKIILDSPPPTEEKKAGLKPIVATSSSTKDGGQIPAIKISSAKDGETPAPDPAKPLDAQGKEAPKLTYALRIRGRSRETVPSASFGGIFKENFGHGWGRVRRGLYSKRGMVSNLARDNDIAAAQAAVRQATDVIAPLNDAVNNALRYSHDDFSVDASRAVSEAGRALRGIEDIALNALHAARLMGNVDGDLATQGRKAAQQLDEIMARYAVFRLARATWSVDQDMQAASTFEKTDTSDEAKRARSKVSLTQSMAKFAADEAREAAQLVMAVNADAATQATEAIARLNEVLARHGYKQVGNQPLKAADWDNIDLRLKLKKNPYKPSYRATILHKGGEHATFKPRHNPKEASGEQVIYRLPNREVLNLNQFRAGDEVFVYHKPLVERLKQNDKGVYERDSIIGQWNNRVLLQSIEDRENGVFRDPNDPTKILLSDTKPDEPKQVQDPLPETLPIAAEFQKPLSSSTIEPSSLFDSPELFDIKGSVGGLSGQRQSDLSSDDRPRMVFRPTATNLAEMLFSSASPKGLPEVPTPSATLGALNPLSDVPERFEIRSSADDFSKQGRGESPSISDNDFSDGDSFFGKITVRPPSPIKVSKRDKKIDDPFAFSEDPLATTRDGSVISSPPNVAREQRRVVQFSEGGINRWFETYAKGCIERDEDPLAAREHRSETFRNWYHGAGQPFMLNLENGRVVLDRAAQARQAREAQPQQAFEGLFSGQGGSDLKSQGLRRKKSSTPSKGAQKQAWLHEQVDKLSDKLTPEEVLKKIDELEEEWKQKNVIEEDIPDTLHRPKRRDDDEDPDDLGREGNTPKSYSSATVKGRRAGTTRSSPFASSSSREGNKDADVFTDESTNPYKRVGTETPNQATRRILLALDKTTADKLRQCNLVKKISQIKALGDKEVLPDDTLMVAKDAKTDTILLKRSEGVFTILTKTEAQNREISFQENQAIGAHKEPAAVSRSSSLSANKHTGGRTS